MASVELHENINWKLAQDLWVSFVLGHNSFDTSFGLQEFVLFKHLTTSAASTQEMEM